MENNEILNLILNKLDNLEQGQRDLEQGQRDLEQGQRDLKQEINQRFDNLEKEIKQNNISIGDKIIMASENLDRRIVETQNTLINKIEDIDDMKLSIEVLDIVSKKNLKDINRLKAVK